MLFFYLLTAIQIFFETFPVSSSGHVFLMKNFFSFEFVQSFLLDKWLFVLHLPTVLVVAVYFFSQWYPLCSFKRKKLLIHQCFLVFFVDVITFLFFLLRNYLSFSFPLPLAFSLNSIILFSLLFVPSRRKTFNVKMALYIGLGQGLIFLFPGISRLATVYTLLRWQGIPSTKAFAISWMVQWPLMVAAGFYGLLVLYYNSVLMNFLTGPMIIIIFCASIASLLGMYCVGWLVKKNDLWIFSMYMIIPIILSLL